VLDRAALLDLGVDDGVVATRRRLDGEPAIAFLAALPELTVAWQRRLGLTGGRVMGGGALSAALACTRVADGRSVVLKLSAAHAPGARAEAAALAAWDGAGACALLEASVDATALVLERIEPGSAVEPSGDERADARRAGELLELLHRPPPPGSVPDGAPALDWRFPRAQRWLAAGLAAAPVSPGELHAAAAAARTLHESGPRVLCHGDFLDKNILRDGERGWRAIDPMACVSDPCRDAAFWALHHSPGAAVRERCALVAAAAGLDPDRVWRWALAFAATEAVLDIGPGRAGRHLRVLQDRLHDG
jgi:streptomycin 6-kinase